MKLPFVLLSREVYEELLTDKRYARKLMRTITRMKLAGGHVVQRPMHVVPRPPDPLDEAIEENKYAKRPEIKRALHRFKDRELKKGTSHQEILRKLQEWTTKGSQPTAVDETEGDVIELEFDDANPRDRAIKAGLTS